MKSVVSRLFGLLFVVLVLPPLALSLAAPILVTPADGSMTKTDDPTFIWNAVSGASFYSISIYADAALIDRVEGADVPTTTYTIPASSYGLREGVYYWAVTARTPSATGPRSAVRSFIAVYQLNPANNSSTSNTTPTFEFDDPPVARDGFRLAVDNNADYSSPEFICATPIYNAGQNRFSCTPGVPLAPGTYYWGVQLGSRSGTFTNPLFSWVVYITGASYTQRPSVPHITSPLSAFEISNQRQILIVWDAANQAAQYEVQVDNNDNFGSPEFSALVPAPTTQVKSAPLPADGRYYVRIRALNPLGDSGWSGATWGNIDTTPPPAPQPFEPASGSSITYTRTPTLRYYASSGQNLYRVQVARDGSFANLVFPTVETTAHNITVGTPLANGTYYWRAQERDPAGNWSAWSATASFIISVN